MDFTRKKYLDRLIFLRNFPLCVTHTHTNNTRNDCETSLMEFRWDCSFLPHPRILVIIWILIYSSSFSFRFPYKFTECMCLPCRAMPTNHNRLINFSGSRRFIHVQRAAEQERITIYNWKCYILLLAEWMNGKLCCSVIGLMFQCVGIRSSHAGSTTGRLYYTLVSDSITA